MATREATHKATLKLQGNQKFGPFTYNKVK